MELRVNTINNVYFDGEPTWAVTAIWSKNGEDQGSLTTSYLTSEGRWSAALPYMVSESNIVVTWTFTVPVTGTVTKSDYYEVVTPYLTTRELKEVHPNGTDKELVRIESAVRHIINAHTGQSFGQFDGTKKVPGRGGRRLQLPARLMSLTSINDNENSAPYFLITGDGYSLHYFPYGVPPVKADYDGWHQHVGGVIHNPNNVKEGTFKNITYDVNGSWGWRSVPEPVKEAALLLVNDYACQDIAYRDRYLSSITAADWNYRYSSGAYTKTGNVRADQLLQEYVLKLGWAVV